MAISAQEVNKLRQMTGAGMMDCKKALTEANGDIDAAIDYLRKKGQKVSASRSDRSTSEGIVVMKTSDDKKIGTIISLRCETDFVAKNDEFIALADNILNLAVTEKPASIEDLLQLKIDSLAIQDKITELVGKIGEKMEIGAYDTVEGDAVVPYTHAGAKLGVLVALKGAEASSDLDAAGRDVAMQIAAMNPVAVDKDGVDADTISKEIEIGKDQARAEGKPDAIIEKIAMGKLNKFLKDNTLLNQIFVKDNSLTIEKYLDAVSAGLTVSEFKRISIS